jgi:hypothetical protein
LRCASAFGLGKKSREEKKEIDAETQRNRRSLIGVREKLIEEVAGGNRTTLFRHMKQSKEAAQLRGSDDLYDQDDPAQNMARFYILDVQPTPN